ncbi:tRNA pseudouridine(13) synthase TruD [Cellvibrio fontiphilus]|uniref:tRNA pseudouridine synthase D n=1 Tax=Cellvibrio fontiphilus TaxID=1815559 RepID=A0ABV7FFL3_9GAMM
MTEFSLDFPRAYGDLSASAVFRDQPEDFKVDEDLGFEPSGSGEHVFLQVLKRGENTAWVAGQIANLAKVAANDVGYAGRKDRHAVTTQWFSVYLPKGAEPDWSLLNSDSLYVIRSARHHQKLRRGDHCKNLFVIRLRAVQTPDQVALGRKIDVVLAQGVPNYYGEQRFGINGNNLLEAEAILVGGKRHRDKQKRGLMLSAARSYLFNQVLASRVVSGNWRELITGEPLTEASGPLWGRGRSLAKEDLLLQEQVSLAPWQAWCDGLEHAGLSQERRALRLLPANTSWRWIGADLELSFSLAAGEFATAILRELAQLNNASSGAFSELEQAGEY